MTNENIPKLGQTVYCIYINSIMKVKVYAIGKDFFINDECAEATSTDSWIYYFSEYNMTWFTKLSGAKQKLIELQHQLGYKNVKIVKYSDDYWEATV